jgi:hypothetical protein
LRHQHLDAGAVHGAVNVAARLPRIGDGLFGENVHLARAGQFNRFLVKSRRRHDAAEIGVGFFEGFASTREARRSRNTNQFTRFVERFLIHIDQSRKLHTVEKRLPELANPHVGHTTDSDHQTTLLAHDFSALMVLDTE